MSDAATLLSAVLTNRYGYGSIQRIEFRFEDDQPFARVRSARWSGPPETMLSRLEWAPGAETGSGSLLVEREPGRYALASYGPTFGVQTDVWFTRRDVVHPMSDLWYDDILAKRPEDWEAVLAGREELSGLPCSVLDVSPRPGVESAYRGMRFWVPDAMPVILRGELLPASAGGGAEDPRVIEADPDHVEQIGPVFVSRLETFTGPMAPQQTRVAILDLQPGTPSADLFTVKALANEELP
jgi:hypothetical protein